MANRTMNLSEFIAFMKSKQGEQADNEFARSVGISPQYLCDIYKGRRVPGDSITAALGVARKTVYVVNHKEGQEK